MPEYVGQILDKNWTPDGKIADPVQPPRLDGQPEFPKTGIYFGMPDEIYHAIPAASTSGLKKMAVSTMDYWATSYLNPDKIEVQKSYFDLGKAIHAFVLEGEDAYIDRFAVELELSDYQGQGVLVSTDEIKGEISQFTEMQPIKPVSGKKQALIDQLSDLASKHKTGINLNTSVEGLKEQIKQFKEERPIPPQTRVPDISADGKEYMRTAGKNDWINQLLGLKPDAKIWDKMVADHHARHNGKTFIDALTDRRIRIAVKMITAHPEISKAFTGGYPEVSIFWHCRATGAPMKARFDYVKMRTLIDLKSFSNVGGMPIDRAIERTIANYRYNLQHVIYIEAAEEAKRMIREQGATSIFHCDGLAAAKTEQRDAWCFQWAKQTDEPGFIFIFQQTGVAPVTRGKIMPTGTVYSVTRSRGEELKRKWVECVKEFGTLPWLDIADIEVIDDEAIPLHATEL